MKHLRILSVMAALLMPLLALGASGRVVEAQAAAGPTPSFQGEFPITVEAGDYDLVYLVLNFAPGAAIPLHYHGGPALVVGMQGTLTLRPEGAAEHALSPGDVMNEKAGARHVMINTSNANASILAGVLLPKGAELTTLVTPPSQPVGMPATGSGDVPALIVWLLIIGLAWLTLGSIARLALRSNR